MSARRPRFEVVQSDAGWFARFVAANGRKVWQTEVYRRRAGAENAIDVFAHPHDSRLTRIGVRSIAGKVPAIEVRMVDERTRP